MILLFLLPFYDRGPERRPERRPIATTAGILTIVAMGYLTYLGAVGRLADRDRHPDPGERHAAGPEAVATFKAGKQVVAQSGCLRLPQDRRERQRRSRPELTDIGARLPEPGDPPHARSTRRRRCRRSRACRRSNPQQFDEMVQFLAELK